MVILGITTLAIVCLRLFFGDGIGWPRGDVWAMLARPFKGLFGGPVEPVTELDVRCFRVALACLVGVSLSTSGVALQALLRNPLAEPFILGLSTGATLGVMLLQWLGQRHDQVMAPEHIGALAGAAATMGLVYVASHRRGVLDPLGLLLVGVVLSTINGAVIMLLHYIMSEGTTPPVTRWIMGYLNEGLDARTVWIVAVVAMVGLGCLLKVAPAMDVATFSDAEAHSLGVNLTRLRTILFSAASLLAAGAVVLAGPLAFVGFICPHVGRLIFGPSHRVLLVGSAMLGAMLILLADVLIVGFDATWNLGRLPLGIFTAMVGGVGFLWMLRSHLGGE